MKKMISALILIALMISTVAFASGSVTAVSGNSYVRSGPGLEYTTLTTLHKGSSASYLDSTSYDDRGVAWYKVSCNGRTGWVSSRYTKLGSYSGGYSTCSSSDLWVRISGGSCNVRKGPGLDYKSMGNLSDGATARYAGSSRTDERGVVWYSIVYSGGTAWVSSRYSYLDTNGHVSW